MELLILATTQADNSGPILASVILGGATMIAAAIAAYSSVISNRRTKTNHGKTIGEHVEAAGVSAEAAKYQAELVALQLDEYKREQSAAAEELRTLILEHAESDVLNFSEVRDILSTLGSQGGDTTD